MEAIPASLADSLMARLDRVSTAKEVAQRAAVPGAGGAGRASDCVMPAGGRAGTQRSANEEAIGHLRRALDLVATLPEPRERHQMERGL